MSKPPTRKIVSGAAKARGGVLFLSYTGLLEPLGQSQVLAYQERLAADWSIHILSFERREDLGDAALVDSVRQRVERAGIHWHPMVYHKRPSALATLWDIAAGAALGLQLVKRHGLRIVHARSYVASVIAILLKRFSGVKFLFDMRGFWADERVDGGLWSRKGRMYKASKWFERKFLLQADYVVSLTNAAATEVRGFDYLQERMPPIRVIPTCADLDRFKPRTNVVNGPFTLGYVGSAGTWYLFDAAVAAFKSVQARRGDSRFLIVNRGSHDYIRERLRAGGVEMAAIELREAMHSEVPALIAGMDAGVFFYKPSYSRAACSPTKLGEFLGCGVPCLSNVGVGDMAQILTHDRVGVAVDALNPTSIDAGVEALLRLVGEPGIQDRCVASARRHFSLTRGVEAYSEIYRSLEQPCAS